MVIYFSVLTALFLAALDQTIVATALPKMVADLHGIDRYAWVATSYLLASTGLALVYGKLADSYPRKHVTIGAIGLFLGGSVLCGLSGEFGTLPLLGDGMTQLVIFRGVQGAGGGGLIAMTFIVIADLFTPAERGRYQGFVGAVFGIASVLGPLIGGLLTDHAGGWIPGIAGWRWVFYVNLPIGGVALWFIVRRMPRLEPTGDREPPDMVGAALLLGGLLPLTLALQLDKRRYPWIPGLGGAPSTDVAAWVTLGLFLLACVMLVSFVRRSRRSASPILDFRLFQNEVFRSANATTFFFGAAFMSVTIFLPLFLVNVLGVSATRAGVVLIPLSLGIVFGATFAGQMVERIGYRRQLFGGGLLFFGAVVLLATMGPSVAYWQVTLYMVFAGVGIGPSLPLFTLAIQNAVDVRFIGQATSASQFFRQMGATFGAAIMGTVLAGTLGLAFSTMELPEALLAAPDASAEQFLSTGGVGLPDRIREAYAELARTAPTEAEAASFITEGNREEARIATELRFAFAEATSRIYWMTALLVLIGCALVLRIPELPLRTTHDRAHAAAASRKGDPLG